MIRDDYAGCGGWTEGLRLLGLTDVGYELMPDAIKTREAAGHETVACDLSTAPDPAGPLEGYVASPPCQTFSTAGNGEGAAILPELVARVHAGDFSTTGIDERTAHVLRVARVCSTVDAGWVALEQVPGVLPVWEAIAHRLEVRGYSVWCGVLCAADFGVPQTRRRAFLLASRDRVVHPPAPTHAEVPVPGLFGTLARWVSMAEALGWSGVVRTGNNSMVTSRTGSRAGDGGVEPYERPTSQPAPTLDTMAGSKWVLRHSFGESSPGSWTDHRVATDRPAPTVETKAGGWCWERPATTVAGDPRITARCHHDEGSQGANAKTTERVQAGDYGGTEPIRLTITEALVLQSFRPDYPLQGSRSSQFLQVGNAVPPLLAAHALSVLTGRTMEVAA